MLPAMATAGKLPSKRSFRPGVSLMSSVYVAGRPSGIDYDKYTTREEAQGLLGCGDAGANKINGL